MNQNNLNLIEYKYSKYKNKYYNLKYNKIENNEMVQYIENNAENSRFDIITKKCKHWYGLFICEQIINNINSTKAYNILVLGVALGSIIIHLANNIHNNINIIGVDINDDDFNLVYSNCPNNVKLICQDAYTYMKLNHMMYDFIVCDIAIYINNKHKIPDFVLTDDFLTLIYNSLNKNGMFLINSIGQTTDSITQWVNLLQNNPKGVNNKFTISTTYDPIINIFLFFLRDIYKSQINMVSILKKV